MRRIPYTLLLYVLFRVYALAQESHLSGSVISTVQYYENDTVTRFRAPEGKLRGMHYVTLDYVNGPWSAGAVEEAYLPQSLLGYDPALKGNLLTDYYIRYRQGPWDVTGGYFYEQLGEGMLLRSWRDRTLGIDNAVRGLRLKYTFMPGLKATLLSGRMRTGMQLAGSVISAASVNVNVNQWWEKLPATNLNLSVLNRYEPTGNNPRLPESVNVYAAEINTHPGNVDLAFLYAYKTPDALFEHGILNDRVLFDGDLYWLNAGYSVRGFGMDITLRRSENMQFYAQRNLQGNFYNTGTVNYIPSLTKQHDYLLTGLYVYATKEGISFDDRSVGEIGGQADVFFRFKRHSLLGGKYGTKVSLNFARWHALKAGFYPVSGTYKRPFAAAGALYYQDFNINVKKKIGRKLKASFHLVDQYYNQAKLEGHGEMVHASTLITDWEWRLPHYSSLRVELEHLFTKQDEKNWVAGGFEYNWNGRVGVYVTDMYNYGLTKIHYYNAGIVYTNHGNRITLGYGRTRGGLVCVGGVCRYVPPSKGLQMTIALRMN